MMKNSLPYIYKTEREKKAAKAAQRTFIPLYPVNLFDDI